MMYTANNIDTDKALKALEESRCFQMECERFERHGLERYYEGIRKGIEIAEGLFNCSNYEKTGRIVDTSNAEVLPCPQCQFDLMGMGVDGKDPAYCPSCGQKLMWPKKD